MDTHEATGAMREVAGKAERKYGEAKDKISDKVRRLMDTDDLRAASGENWDNLMEMVQENPGSAVGISVLVGAGLGALIAYLARD